LKYLHDSKSNFREILTIEEFVSNRGNKDFSTNPSDLRSAKPVKGDIYAETNLSANQIRDRIKKLLDYFQINSKKFVIHLKEERDWRSENIK
jgi:hypothetical protein